MKEIKIIKIDKIEQKHGDHLIFAFMSLENLKTYCYISLKQLDILGKDFKLTEITETLEKTSYWTKKVALADRKIINIGLFYLLKSEKEYELAYGRKNLNIYKKTPILETILSDKPEIFHGIKTSYSYKQLSKFRFYQFVHDDRKESEKKNISYQIKGFTSIDQLTEFIFGESSKVLNKLTLQILFDIDKDSMEPDYNFIRYIHFIRRFLSTEEIIKLLAKPEEVKSSYFYKEEFYGYMFSGVLQKTTGIPKFFKQIKSFNNKKRLLLKWNIKAHIVDKFDEVMEIAYPKFELDLDKVSDPTYFYNTISRDYGRLFLNDFTLKEQFPNVAKKLDGLKSGRFTFKVPKKYSDLVVWGSKLCNCAGNFDQIEYYSKGLTIGVFENDQIVYLIDYRAKYSRPTINQLKGYKNGTVKTRKEIDEIAAVFSSNNFISDEDLKDLYKKGE